MAQNPKDSRIMEQEDTIGQLNTVISSQNEPIRSLRNTAEECNSTIAGLRQQVGYLTKKLFGTSSERSRNIEGQLNPFNEAEQEMCPADGIQETETVIVEEHTRRAKRTGDGTFKGVPSRDEAIPLSEEQRYCGDCGSEMEVIGKEFVRRGFRFTPAKGEVVNIYRETANVRNVLWHPPWPGIPSL